MTGRLCKRLGFRTRGGPTQGWGNVFRLASFARYCQDAADVHPVFFAEGPLEVEEYLRKQGFEVYMLPEDIVPVEEDALLAKHDPVEVFFAEMLDITPGRQAVLSKYSKRLVVFDDLCDHAYKADLVVSGQNLPSHANRALSEKHTRFLVGYDYFLCRPEFLTYRDRSREYANSIEKVLVTLGGGAYSVGYLKAAHALAGTNLQATFILGYASHGDLAERLHSILPDAQLLAGVNDMPERLWDTDLVIGSAGYTKLEAALTQTPCLMMSVQWHQIPLAQSYAECTGTPDLGYMSYVEPESILRELKQLAPAGARIEQCRRASLAVDGKGFERVHGEIFKEVG